LFDQVQRHRLVERETVRAFAGHVPLQIFVLCRLADRVHTDVVLER
jgi:hypothetical protein